MSANNVTINEDHFAAVLWGCGIEEIRILDATLTARATALAITQVSVSAATAYTNPNIPNPTLDVNALVTYINSVDTGETASIAILRRMGKTLQDRLDALKPAFT